MSQYDDRVRDHSIWESMEALGPAIDKALGREDIDPQIVEGLERVRAVLTFAGKRLAGANPQLMEPRSLDSINSNLQNALSEIVAFTQNGNKAHIESANSQADLLLTILPAINYPFVADDWRALNDAAKAYRESLEQNLRQIHDSSTKALGEIANLQQIANDLQSQFSGEQESRNQEFAKRVDAALAEIQTDSKAVQKRLEELKAEIENERTRLTNLTSDFQAQFSAAQENRSQEFAKAQSDRQDRFGSVLAEYNQRLTEQNTEFSAQRDKAFKQYEENVAELKEKYAKSAEGILDEIERYKIQVEKLVGVIGNLGVTSGYLTTAAYARKMTWIWQGVTVAAFVFFIYFAYEAFLPSLTQASFHWESFAGRVVLTLAVGVLAAYARSQSDKYFEAERRNRKLALELEAIGPFIAALPKEKQDELRARIGDRSFGHADADLSQRTDKSPATLLEVIGSEEFRKLLTETITQTLSTVIKAKGA